MLTFHRRSVFNTCQSQKPEPTAPRWMQHWPGVRNRNGVTGNGGGEQFPILDAPVPFARNSEKGPAIGTDSYLGIGRSLPKPAGVKFGNRSRTPLSLFLAVSEVQHAVVFGRSFLERLGQPVDGLIGDLLHFNQSCLLWIPNFPSLIANLRHGTHPHALSAGAAEERELGSGGIGFEIGD